MLITTLIAVGISITLNDTLEWPEMPPPSLSDITIVRSEPVVSESIPEPEIESKPSIYCSCVRTARLYGNIPLQDADKFKTNSPPFEGGFALFKFTSGLHHIAYIEKIETDRFLVVEGNYKPCKKTKRWVDWNDKTIKGFYRPTV